MTGGLTSITDYAQAVNAGDFDNDAGFRYLVRKTVQEKSWARNRVVSIIHKLSDRREPLNILTMPSVTWAFEKQLINGREHGRGLRRPRCTHITAIESHAALYRAACLTMPGADRGLAVLPAAPYAAETVRTFAIARFHRCTFEDLSWAMADAPFSHHFAWIDLCGQLSTRRLDALASLWEHSISRALIVTSLRGRWEAGLNDRIAEHGVAGEIARWLPGAHLYDEHTYADGVSMHQVTFTKEAA